jgi:Fe-S cluster assembly protein SufD
MTESAAQTLTGRFEDAVAAAFATARANSQEPAWIASAREAAFKEFMQSGLPHRKSETWKYTDLRKHLAPSYLPAPANLTLTASGNAEARTISSTASTASLALRPLLARTPSVVDQINLALFSDGAIIRVPASENVVTPIVLEMNGPEPGHMAHVRNLIHLAPGAQAALIEQTATGPQSAMTISSRIELSDGAHLRHIRIVEAAGAGANILSVDNVKLDQGARYELTEVRGGSGLIASELIASIGAAADIRAALAVIAGGQAHVDWRGAFLHQAPNGYSRLNARSVLGDSAFAAVQGRVEVAPAALKTDSHQLAKALLLSPRAQSVHKPELEIFADDVKCGHGAAVGSLSAEQLFYLRSRGVPRQEAKTLLTEAFLSEVLSANGAGPGDAHLPAAQTRLLQGLVERLA